jgi:hypothetical protein
MIPFALISPREIAPCAKLIMEILRLTIFLIVLTIASMFCIAVVEVFR